MLGRERNECREGFFLNSIIEIGMLEERSDEIKASSEASAETMCS